MILENLWAWDFKYIKYGYSPKEEFVKPETQPEIRHAYLQLTLGNNKIVHR